MNNNKDNYKITEEKNTTSTNLDQMNSKNILSTINREDTVVVEAVRKEIPTISTVVNLVTEGLNENGRLFYVGAGTSGRLGVIDAVECTPTFSVKNDTVIPILAGGKEAMFVAKENAEDNFQAGRKEINKYKLKTNDTVIGISASGETPYVLGAIEEANKNRAVTIGLVCNTNTLIKQKTRHTIETIVGPEVITGSTRMKAGTAQKLVLNMISTTVMIKLGKVYSNYMVDLKPTNKKLRERAKKIFVEITNSTYEEAEKYLKKSNYDVKVAIVMFKKKCKRKKAEDLLKEHNNFLRPVIEN